MKNNRNIFKILTVVLCSTSLLACVTNSPVSQVGVYDPDFALQIERGRNIVAPVIRRGSGVSVAVGVNGQLVWSEGFGFTSLKQSTAISADDPLRLYSLMKQVTSVLALQSVLRGEIAFDTTARELLPDLPAAFESVTLQQLLTHTSGVRHYHHPAEANFFTHCESASPAIDRFVHDPLVHEAGTSQTYSTYGFVLASAMLEQATELSFPELMQQRIAEPAGMTSLQLEDRNAPAGAVQFYDVDNDGNIATALPVDNSCKMGGGGFLSSAADVVKFHNAVMNGTLAPLPAIRQLLGGRSALEAAGSGAGGEAMSIADLDSRVSVVVLSNTSGLEQRIALERVRGLLQAVFEEQVSNNDIARLQ